MNVSQITEFTPNTFIWLPNTDALMYMTSVKCRDKFLLDYGDRKVIKVNNVYTVPDWAEDREEYIRIKSADCAIWGCE
jgi:hypothetical protein